MKRELIQEIEDCYGCPFLETEDGFADHLYRCPHFGDSDKIDCSSEQYAKVHLQIQGWFENCPKWREIV
jgi:hypothetical protein